MRWRSTPTNRNFGRCALGLVSFYIDDAKEIICVFDIAWTG
jgi:hypothetical protein